LQQITPSISRKIRRNGSVGFAGDCAVGMPPTHPGIASRNKTQTQALQKGFVVGDKFFFGMLECFITAELSRSSAPRAAL
jgi:hypothetical protein